MTTAIAPDVAGETLYAALPPRAQVHVARTKRLDYLAAHAFDRGWTIDQLVQRTTSGDLGVNPGRGPRTCGRWRRPAPAR